MIARLEFELLRVQKILLVSVLATLVFACKPKTSENAIAPLPDHKATLSAVNDCWFAKPEGRLIECSVYTPADMPSGKLRYVILRNNEKRRTADALMYIPGGPGSSSLLTEDGIQHWLNWYAQSTLSVDLVLLDRRGVGFSTPSWRCAEYDDFSRQILSENVSLLSEMAQGNRVIKMCLDKMRGDGFDERLFSTRQSAEDVAGVLQSAGYDRWHLFGVSYGTRLALAVYQFFPERVATLILDSLYTPEQGRLTDWPEILHNAFARYWQRCPTLGYCSGSTVIEAQFWQVMKQLKANPVRVVVQSWYSSKSYEVLVNDQRLLGVLFGSLYDRYLYPVIATTLNELVRYRTDSLARLVETYVNSAFDPSFNDWLFYTVECRDNRPV